MTATLVHPFVQDELDEGRRQAQAFLDRLAVGPAHVDDLAQQFELARMGSMARARGFAARLQEVLREAGHATS